MVYMATVNSIIPSMAAGTIGTMSDKYGRRFALFLPCLGGLLHALVILAFCVWDLSFWTVIIAGFLSGVAGGSGTIFCGFFTYAADVSQGEKRSMNFAILEGVQDFGVLLGNLAVGWIVTAWGTTAPFVPIAAVFLFLVAYVLAMPESLSSENRVEKLDWRKANVLGALANVWKPSGVGRPAAQGLLAATFTLTYTAFIGFVIILVLYAKQLFHWDPNTISYFAASQSAARAVGALFLAPLLFRRASRALLPAHHVISVSILAQTVAFSIYATAKNTGTMFMGTAFEGLSSVAIPTIRAVFSRANPASEQGKVLSVISAIETLVNVLIPIFIPYIFSVTNVECPRCAIYVVTGIGGLGFLVSLLFSRVATPLPSEAAHATAYEPVKADHEEKERTSCPYIHLQEESGPRLPLYSNYGSIVQT